MRVARKYLWAVLAAVAVTALDQWTKLWVARELGYGEAREVLPFLSFKYVLNPGSAFGFLAGADPVARMVFFSVVGLAAVFAIVILAARTKTRAGLAAYALVFAGAAGNLIDRIRAGSVTDFIDLHAGALHWWIFNVTDIAITAGVALLLVEGLFLQSPARKAARPTS